MFDIAVIEKNNWQMYGSCKPNNQTYKLTKIFEYTNNNNTINRKRNNTSEIVELVHLLSIPEKFNESDIKIRRNS